MATYAEILTSLKTALHNAASSGYPVRALSESGTSTEFATIDELVGAIERVTRLQSQETAGSSTRPVATRKLEYGGLRG
jgi:hypothetical protein